jgi:hypothetical protein
LRLAALADPAGRTSSATRSITPNQETTMKVKSNVKAGLGNRPH